MKINGGETSQTKQVSGKNLDPYKLLDTNGMEASKQGAQAMQHLKSELSTLRSKHEAENLTKTNSIATTNNSSGTSTGQTANSKDNFVNKIFGVVDLIVKKLVQVKGTVTKPDSAIAQNNSNKNKRTLDIKPEQPLNKLENNKDSNLLSSSKRNETMQEVNLIKNETEILSLPDSVTLATPQRLPNQNNQQSTANVKHI